MDWLLKNSQMGLVAKALAYERHCLVGTAVIDDNDLIGITLGVAKRKNLLQTFADSPLFIVSRDDQ